MAGFGLYSHRKKDNIATPETFYDELNKEFHFDHDPCPLKRIKGRDGLKDEWADRNYVNPPFSKISKWLEKGVNEMLVHGRLSVFLITARTNSKYWFEWVYPYAAEIRFLEKGLKFRGYKKAMPIPMVLVVFDKRRLKRRDFSSVDRIEFYSLK